MPSLRPLAALCALALLLVACSATGATGPSPSGAAGACVSRPEPSDMSAWGPPATTPKLTPVLVTNAVTCGRARIMMLYLDSTNHVASAPDRTVSATFYDLAADPNKAVDKVTGTFVWTIENDRGMYILETHLTGAGTWGIEFTTEAPGSPAETVRMTMPVRESLPTVAIGQPAPASKTPTSADVGGDLTKISTDATPDPAFYKTSVADAIAAHKPFILIFATPKFCTSAQCGPTLDRFKPVAAANPDATFINVEPYQLKVVDGQLQPVLDANGQLQATAITDQWGLLSEPWMFAVDKNGVVQGSYEVTMTDAEIAAILPVIKSGG